jgi:hypothetical protein
LQLFLYDVFLKNGYPAMIRNSADEAWKKAKKKYRLSARHIQMAKELGLNPKKFGKLGNHKQEPWKEPLPDFIETIYNKRFKKP